MQPEYIELSKYRLDKSKSDLKAAKILRKKGFYPQSLNRSYYSIFHAARALLALDRFDSQKHSGIIAYFNKKYILGNILDKSFSKIILSAERIRNKSDYDDFFIVSKEIVIKQIENAGIFLNGIENLIKSIIQKNS